MAVTERWYVDDEEHAGTYFDRPKAGRLLYSFTENLPGDLLARSQVPRKILLIHYKLWRGWLEQPPDISGVTYRGVTRNRTCRSDLVRNRFEILATRWRDETQESSSIPEIVSHPAYLQIIALGTSVIPFILEDLRRETGHWFAALTAITGGENPIPKTARGGMRQMAQAWLDWGRAQGYLT